MTLSWKMGFEIELMAAPGGSREALAQAVATSHGGTVRRFFHPQSEPSVVPGQPVFENLTLAFEALDANGARIAAFVDDLTLQGGLDKRAAAKPGWYRIVADDGRLLRLVMGHCDPHVPLERMLDPLAALFGTAAQVQANGMVRVVDDRGLSVAIGAPLPGERERPCEIVTVPLEADHAAVLGELLGEARAQGFTVPLEGATHIHFDATPLLSASAIARLVGLLNMHGAALKKLVGTNPNCVRLGAWPDKLLPMVRSDAFAAMDWQAARAALASTGVTKYCDFNLANIASENRAKHTFELRILPVWLEPEPILDAAALFEALLELAATPDRPMAATLPELIGGLPQKVHFWLDRARAL